MNRRALGAMIAASAVVFATLALLRWHTFHNRTFDLAFYARIAWGEAHRDGWNPIVDAHVRGLHLSWILVPLGWIGTVLGQVPTLLITQAIALPSAAWPLARIAERRLGGRGALLVALAWLLHPNLSHVATTEFHPGSVAVLPLAWALEALDRRSPRGVGLSALGVLACREDLGLVTGLLGASSYLLGLRDRTLPQARALRRTGALVALGSLAYVAFFVLYLHPRYAPEHGSLELHFGRWGRSVPEVIAYLATHPRALWAHLGAADRLLAIPLLCAPFALLPFVRPAHLLLATPVLAMSLVSVFPGTASLGSHYLTPALPCVAVSAIHGAAALPDRALLRFVPLATCAVLSHVLAGATPLSIGFSAADYCDDDNGRAARSIVARIPPDASVQAPDALLPHLAERRVLRRAPPPEANTAFVVLDLSHRRRFRHREDLLRTTEEPVARAWLSRTDHALVAAGGDYVLLERGRPYRQGIGVARHVVGQADPDAGTPLCRCLSLLGAHLRGEGHRRSLVLDLVAREPCPDDLALRIGRDWRPARVDLIADGLLSPAHLLRGDRVRSVHPISDDEMPVRIGALRSSGARPEHEDPMSVPVPLEDP